MNKLQRWVLHTFFKPSDITNDSKAFGWLYPRDGSAESLLFTVARLTEMTHEVDDPDELEMSFSLSSRTNGDWRQREVQTKILADGKPIIFHCSHMEERIRCDKEH